MDKLMEIREREKAAAPGPWDAQYDSRKGNYAVWARPHNSFKRWVCVTKMAEAPVEHEATADFIAHARADIPYLLSLIDKLNERVGDAEVIHEYIDREFAIAEAQLNRYNAKWRAGE